MLPAPTTIATCTPWSRTALTCRATAATRSGSVPNSSSPISASPESFRRMRLKTGATVAESLQFGLGRIRAGRRRDRTRGARSIRAPRPRACARPRLTVGSREHPGRLLLPASRGHKAQPQGLLAYGEADEAAHNYVLAGLGGELVAQLLNGLALELGVVQLLLEQHDRLVPRVELAGDDPLAHVLGLVGRLLLVDAGLGVAPLGGHLLAADVGDGRGGG